MCGPRTHLRNNFVRIALIEYVLDIFVIITGDIILFLGIDLRKIISIGRAVTRRDVYPVACLDFGPGRFGRLIFSEQFLLARAFVISGYLGNLTRIIGAFKLGPRHKTARSLFGSGFLFCGSILRFPYRGNIRRGIPVEHRFRSLKGSELFFRYNTLSGICISLIGFFGNGFDLFKIIRFVITVYLFVIGLGVLLKIARTEIHPARILGSTFFDAALTLFELSGTLCFLSGNVLLVLLVASCPPLHVTLFALHAPYFVDLAPVLGITLCIGAYHLCTFLDARKERAVRKKDYAYDEKNDKYDYGSRKTEIFAEEMRDDSANEPAVFRLIRVVILNAVYRDILGKDKLCDAGKNEQEHDAR